MARAGYARGEGMGAPRERAVRGGPLALRRRGELPARRDHQIVLAGRHRGQPSNTHTLPTFCLLMPPPLKGPAVCVADVWWAY